MKYRMFDPVFITYRPITKAEHAKLKRHAALQRFKMRKMMRRQMLKDNT